MRISDCSSDVCSSDLVGHGRAGDGIGDHRELAEFIVARPTAHETGAVGVGVERAGRIVARCLEHRLDAAKARIDGEDWKSGGWGKGSAVGVDLGCRSILKKQEDEKSEL